MSDRQVVDNKPSLRTLSHVLRNPELWPAGFEWNWHEPSMCAVGLAHKLWPMSIEWAVRDHAQKAFGLTIKASYQLFFTGNRRGESTPAFVADLIDAHLAAQ